MAITTTEPRKWVPHYEACTFKDADDLAELIAGEAIGRLPAYRKADKTLYYLVDEGVLEPEVADQLGQLMSDVANSAMALGASIRPTMKDRKVTRRHGERFLDALVARAEVEQVGGYIDAEGLFVEVTR